MLDDNLIEKLMELGIGMTMVKQIPDIMNGTLYQRDNNKKASCQTPPRLKPQTDSCTYIALNGQQAGPFNESELKLLVDKGLINEHVLVWRPNMTQWAPAKCVPEVNKHILLASLNNNEPIVKNNDKKLFDEVTAAMSNLGFKASTTKKVIESVLNANPGISLEDAIKEVLKGL